MAYSCILYGCLKTTVGFLREEYPNTFLIFKWKKERANILPFPKKRLNEVYATVQLKKQNYL